MSLLNKSRALVRPPGNSFVRAISTTGLPINVELAQEQHRSYCDALETAGVQVVSMPPDERFPDSCFTQDPAVVIGGVAVLGRLAMPSRMGEVELIEPWLAAHTPIERIQPPGTLEGGDILVLEDRVVVGETGRTNREGVEQLGEILARRGVRVEVIQVRGFLHLLTAVSYPGRGVLVAHEDFELPQSLSNYDPVRVARAEAYAANTLGLGECVVLPAGYPRTAAALRARGFETLEVEMSEFYKADGGVSCLCLLL